MTPYRNFAAMLAVLGLIAYACVPPSHAATLDPRSSDVGGVLVVVQPQTNAPIDEKWEFNVTMNTHSKPLTVDVAHAAVLFDDTGQRVTAATWRGDAPGGHHSREFFSFLLRAQSQNRSKSKSRVSEDRKRARSNGNSIDHSK